MRRILIHVLLLAAASLPAATQSHPPEQPDCRLDAKAETGISCTGIEWPPRPKTNQASSGVVNVKAFAKRRTAPDISELVRVRSPNYKGPEPMRVERKRDRYERPVPKFAARQIADKKFWATVALATAATVFDAESTKYGVARGFAEGNPLFGRNPSRARLYGIKFAFQAFTQHVPLYIYKKWDMRDSYIGAKSNDYPKWWQLALGWPGVGFAIGGHNFARASGHPVVHR